MANETPITIVGNLTRDPELKVTNQGQSWVAFTVATTPRTLDKNTGQWADGEPMFLDVTAWRQLAEHVVETLSKGSRVIVTGRLRQSHWETDTGEKRSRIGLQADDIGPSLQFATASINKTNRASSTDSGSGSSDVWATPSGSGSSEAPF